MLGLDRGGACRGIAFRVAAKQREDTVAYLRGREQTTNVYREVMRSVWLENEARQRVSALAYVVDRGHVQYAGRLSLADSCAYVQQGHGRSGNNRDYVLSTVKSIEKQGFRDRAIAPTGGDAARRASGRAAAAGRYLSVVTLTLVSPGRLFRGFGSQTWSRRRVWDRHCGFPGIA